MQTAGGAPNVAAGVFYWIDFWTEYFLDRFFCDAVTFSSKFEYFRGVHCCDILRDPAGCSAATHIEEPIRASAHIHTHFREEEPTRRRKHAQDFSLL